MNVFSKHEGKYIYRKSSGKGATKTVGKDVISTRELRLEVRGQFGNTYYEDRVEVRLQSEGEAKLYSHPKKKRVIAEREYEKPNYNPAV